MTEPIGIIGIGLLGTAIAERLIAAGHTVVGFDSASDARSRFAALGREAVAALVDVAKCRYVILSLPDMNITADIALIRSG